MQNNTPHTFHSEVGDGLGVAGLVCSDGLDLALVFHLRGVDTQAVGHVTGQALTLVRVELQAGLDWLVVYEPERQEVVGFFNLIQLVFLFFSVYYYKYFYHSIMNKIVYHLPLSWFNYFFCII